MNSPATLRFHRCMSCGAIDAACIDTCAKCLDTNMEPLLVSGTGTLASWTTIRKPPLRFKTDGIYHVAVIDLDNGIRVTGRLLLREGDRVGDHVEALQTSGDRDGAPLFKTTRPD